MKTIYLAYYETRMGKHCPLACFTTKDDAQRYADTENISAVYQDVEIMKINLFTNDTERNDTFSN